MRRDTDEILWGLLEGTPLEWFSFVCGLVLSLAVLWMAIRFFARMRDGDDPAVNDQQMLMQIGEMHRQGNLDETEYRSIKVSLADRLNEEQTESESKFDD